MSAARTFATARRVMLQLRHDPRTIALLILVPCVLETLLRLIYDRRRAVFDQAGAPLLAFFPLTTVFLRARRSRCSASVRPGTLERLLTTPLGRLELLTGYAIAFGLVAAVQAGVVSALTLGPLGLHVEGPVALVVVLAVCVALLGIGLGLLASAFARTEFQVVQFFPLIHSAQLLLCGLLVARQRMPGALHAISQALPLSYAVDGMHHLSRQAGASGALLGDIAIGAGLQRRRPGARRRDVAPRDGLTLGRVRAVNSSSDSRTSWLKSRVSAASIQRSKAVLKTASATSAVSAAVASATPRPRPPDRRSQG